MSNCVFCAILNKEIPARVIAENENALAFLDVNPISDGHTIIISKKHYKYLSETPVEVLSDMIKLCHEVGNKIANSSLKPWGFNYLSNEGKIAGQEVMHIHMHVIPKYGKEEGFKFGLEKNHYVNNDLDYIQKQINK